MAMGLIFLNGEAILVFRVFRKERKRFTKLLHISIHSIAIFFALIALKGISALIQLRWKFQLQLCGIHMTTTKIARENLPLSPTFTLCMVCSLDVCI